MTHLNVAVRVRPLSDREIDLHSIPVVEVYDKNIIAITNLKVPEQNAGDSRERVRRFSFDYCFDTNSSQEEVFGAVEEVVGEAIKKKYHSCVFAYGQSSSGKTHTMMGLNDAPGVTPRLCERIFTYLKDVDADGEEKKVTVSYLEIYNEKVKDLLLPHDNEHTNAGTLKVREHPLRGTYVQGLKQHPVDGSEALLQWLRVGSKKRRVSETSVNRQSSRSHSIFTISCFDGVKLSLVDLAGSERTGSRSYVNTSTFREGANINKSLVALGNVIFALADQSIKHCRGFRKRFIPYRDSVLTWLLKDTLGGNSKTLMIATISPSSTCYNETVNTLRFGHRAKQIISQPVVNEDPKQRTIRDLRSEIARLKELLSLHQISPELTVRPQSEVVKRCSCEDQASKKDNVTVRDSSSNCEGATSDEATNTDGCYTNENSFLNANIKNLIFEHIRNNFVSKTINLGNNISDSNIENILAEIYKRNLSTKPLNGSNAPLNNSYLSEDQYVGEVIHNDFHQNSSIPNNIFALNSLVSSGGTSKPAQLKSGAKPDPQTLCLKTEKIIPVMDVTSAISDADKAKVKLRRTFSVCSADMESKRPKIYGSHETLSNLANGKAKKNQAATLRKRSLDKSTSSIRSLVMKKSLDKSSAESLQEKSKGTATDMKGHTKVEAKVDSIRKVPIKPRSEIVAAVTNRLYAKVKKKEVATETDDVVREHKGTLARLRLQDITHRALKVYRRKTVETQTETCPALRVKETSTDVVGLQADLNEVKHAHSSTEAIETKDMSVNCNFVNSFAKFDGSSLVLTNSCGTQAAGEARQEEAAPSPPNPNAHVMSFTKYLQRNEAKIEVANPYTANPIYTTSVNINVSHNYINGSKAGSVSDDSLDEQSVCFPTPDLISNHNSLEHHQGAPLHDVDSSANKLRYATSSDVPDAFVKNKEYAAKKTAQACKASCSVAPECKERVQAVDIPGGYAPEICLLKDRVQDRCRPLRNARPKSYKPQVSENAVHYNEPHYSEDPIVLKSIMKQKLDYDSDSSDVSLHTFENVPDSLNYHINKKVHFHEEPAKSGRMFEVMADFLKEATSLMTNLSSVASKLDQSSEQAYDLQVTVNDVGGLIPRNRRHRKKSKRKGAKRDDIGCQTLSACENTSSQTSPKRTLDVSTDTEVDLPENKYEQLVESACNRLEQCIDTFAKKRATDRNAAEESSLHRFPQPFSITPDWHLDHGGLQPEDSSLESNPTFSDYGSLPRRKVKHAAGYSPSAYLRQLTTMRKQIVDHARDELINDSHPNPR